MKNWIKILLLLILHSWILHYNASYAQNIFNTPNFDKFSIISSDTLFYNLPRYALGQIGSINISNTSKINPDSTLSNTNQLFNSAIQEVDSISEFYFQYPNQNIINQNYNGLIIDTGVSYYQNDFIVNYGNNLKLIGNTEDVIVININGNLIFEKNSYMILEGILPENIIWNIKGEIIIKENSYIFGTFISFNNITLDNNVKGSINLFSFKNITVNSIESLVPRCDLSYSSINSFLPCNSASCTSNVDLVIDGNFNNAICNNPITFITSFYKICSLTNQTPFHGNFTLAQNAINWGKDWGNLYDHTPNASNGYFLLCDGFSQSSNDKDAWRKTISLKRGTKYKFYMYVANPNPSATRGKLKISCTATSNSSLTFEIPTFNEGWKLVCYEFTTQSGVNNINATIIISQTETFGDIGWDFAIDDIQLFEISPPAVVTLDDDLIYECNSGQVVSLTATISPTVSVSNYIWYKQINNYITQIPNVSGSTYVPTEAGNYRVKCIFYGNCESEYSNWVYVSPPPTAHSNNYIVEFNNQYLPTWTATFNPFNSSVIVINSEFRVKSGVNLNLKGLKFEFGPNAKFVIEAGATVTLESNLTTPTILTAYNCPNNMWQGVELVTSFIDEIPFNGRIIIKNSCVIENARIGINNNIAGFKQIVDYFGCVNATGAIFRNNYISVYLNSNRSILNNISKFNKSTFTSCTFINNSALKDIVKYPNGLHKSHIELLNTKGVRITGNIFENSFYTTALTSINNVYDDASLKLNKGINAFNSNYIFSGNNEFRNLWVGIEHSSIDNSFQNQKFYNIKFLSNVYGLIIRGGSNIIVDQNTFTLSSTYPEGNPIRLDRNYIGINARGCNNTKITNNTFTNLYCGIITVDFGKSKMQKSEISNNLFNDVGRVLKSNGQGIYSIYNNSNTQFKCNTFKSTTNSNITNHWVVDGLISTQGSCYDDKSPARNIFENEPIKSDILVQSGQEFIYYTHNLNTEIIKPKMKKLPNYNDISSSFILGCNFEYYNNCSNNNSRNIEDILQDIENSIGNFPYDSTVYTFVFEALYYYSENDSTPDSKINLLNSLPLEDFKWLLVSEYFNNQQYNDAYEQLSILNIDNDEKNSIYQYYHLLINKLSQNIEINEFSQEDSMFISNISNSNYSIAYQAQSIMSYYFNCSYSIPLPYDIESGSFIIDTSLSQKNNLDILLHPNPATNNLNITSKNIKIKSISILNIDGRLVKTFENTNTTNITINIDFINNGIYFVKILDINNQTHIKKIIVNKQ